jgi:hypothetical protein
MMRINPQQAIDDTIKTCMELEADAVTQRQEAINQMVVILGLDLEQAYKEWEDHQNPTYELPCFVR